MKHIKWIFFSICLIFFWQKGTLIYATDEEDIMLDDAVVDEISMDGIQEYWDTLVNDYGGYVPELEKQSIYDLIKKKESCSLKNTLIGTCEFLFHELSLDGNLLGRRAMRQVWSVLLQTPHAGFRQSAVSKIAYFVVFIVFLFSRLNSFHVTVSYVEVTIDSMISFMSALLTPVLGLMATFGN